MSEADNNNNNNNNKRKKDPNDGGPNEKMKGTSLILAAKRGDYDTVKELLDNGANVNQTNKNGWTALHAAAYEGHTEVVALLLEWGANVNQADDSGATVLSMAACKGHIEIVRLLLDPKYGVHMNVEANLALNLATYQGHTDIVSLLLDKGVDVNRGDAIDGTRALQLAIERGNMELVNLLLGVGADLGLLPEEARYTLDSHRELPDGQDSIATCAICLEDLSNPNPNPNPKGPAIRTACKHIFHRDCLIQTIELRPLKGEAPPCPICRVPIIIRVEDLGKAIKKADGFRLCAMGLKF